MHGRPTDFAGMFRRKARVWTGCFSVWKPLEPRWGIGRKNPAWRQSFDRRRPGLGHTGVQSRRRERLRQAAPSGGFFPWAQRILDETRADTRHLSERRSTRAPMKKFVEEHHS